MINRLKDYCLYDPETQFIVCIHLNISYKKQKCEIKIKYLTVLLIYVHLKRVPSTVVILRENPEYTRIQTR